MEGKGNRCVPGLIHFFQKDFLRSRPKSPFLCDNFLILLQMSKTIDHNLVVGWMHGSVCVCMCVSFYCKPTFAIQTIRILGLSEKLS